MAERGLPSGWELPAPGEPWTAPGAVPEAAYPPHPPQPQPFPPQPQAASYPPPPAAPAVVREGQHLGAMSMITAVLLALAGLASIAVALAFRDRASGVGDARSMSEVELVNFVPELIDLDEQVAAATVAYLLLYVCTGIAWVIWQRRYVRNASAFAPVAPSLGWGTWGWFVPIAGLLLPQAQLANAARVTDPIRVRSELSGAAPPILYCWWIAFVGSSIVQLGSSLTRPATLDPVRPAVSLHSFQQADQFAALSYWFSAGAAVLGLATVLVCTARQRSMLAALDVRV